MKKLLLGVLISVILLAPIVSFASVEVDADNGEDIVITTERSEEATEHSEADGGHGAFAIVFLMLAIIILAAKLGGLVEKFGQPPVLGELIAGIILGNLALFGWQFFDQIKHNEFISFLSELGVVILLFQIGLESNIHEMKKVGLKAFIVATIGVVIPFVIGTYVVGPYFFPTAGLNTYLFLGATMTATSVGITARVFKDLNKIKTKEAKIVLGAAVIDDVVGLLILAVVSAIVVAGTISFGQVGIISVKAVAFLVGSIVIGRLLAPRLGKFLSRVHSGAGTKVGLALMFCLTFAYLAAEVGLAPIVGAFAAGLVLDPVHFKWFKAPHFTKKLKEISDRVEDEKIKEEINKEISHFRDRHVEELIEDIAYFLVPIFFVYTGMSVDLKTFIDPKVLALALVVTVAAIIGKLVCGLGAGKGVNKWIIGVGMVPRGEVGLIFASVGAALGVVTPEIYSVIVIMVIVTTLIPPPILAVLLKRMDKEVETPTVQA